MRPLAADDHTAVWTGNEMIVWGGDDGSNFVNTGSRYDPRPTVGQPRTLLAHPLADSFTRQSGAAVK